MKQSLFIVFLLLVANQSFAGREGGGGRGVVCRTSNGEIASAELLDLWEARTLSQTKIVESSNDTWVQVETAFQLLKNAPYIPYFTPHPTGPRIGSDEMQLTILRYRAANLKQGAPGLVLLRGVNLTDTPDSEETAVPVGCKIEQIVNFMDAPDQPRILVNQDIVDHLSPTNQAALIVHESLYAELRESGEQTSVRVRRAVGYVFGAGSFPSMEDSIRGKKYVLCRSAKGEGETSSIYIYARPDGRLTASANQYWGLYSLGMYPAEKYTDDVLEFLFGTALEAVVSDKAGCAKSAKWELPTLSVSIKGQGPVDFQRAAYLNFRCPNRKLEISMTNGEGKNHQTLQCRLLDDAKPFPFPKPTLK